MNKVIIHSPIWKTRSVGIAEHRITDKLQIEIDYKNRFGERIYPNPFYITKEKALTYPIQIVKGVKLRIIPIVDMENDKI